MDAFAPGRRYGIGGAEGVTGSPLPLPDSEPALRLAVHGRYGADAGFALEGASERGVFLRRLPGSANVYVEDDAAWLCWNDEANNSRLQVLARVSHGDHSGLRLRFEPGQAPGLIAQVQALVPRRSLADGHGPTPADRAIALIADCIRSDFVDAIRNLVDLLLADIEAGAVDAAPDVLGPTPREAAKQLQAQRGALENEFRRRMTLAWRTPAGDAAAGAASPGLQLLPDVEMRAWLVGREMSRALARECEPLWRPLRAQLEFLLRDREGASADALAATAVIDAMSQSLHAAEVAASIHGLFLQAVGRRRGFDLAALYELIARALQRARILPEQLATSDLADRPGAPAAQPAAATPVPAQAPPAASGHAFAAPPSRPPDPTSAWSTLRRIGAPAASGVDAQLLAGGGAVADSVLLRAAAELLGGSSEAHAGAFHARLQQRARLLSGDVGAPLERRQHEAVDLVARIHEALDEDPLVPAGLRELCRPLLRPILASELQGQGIGEVGTPLRRLLSLVEFGSALFASRQDPATNRLRAALDQELSTLAQAQPWTMSLLEGACERVEHLLQRHRAASQAGEKRVVESCEGQQRIADARVQVQQELGSLFAGHGLAQPLRELLTRRVASILLPILLRAGPEAAEWKQIIGRIEQLHADLGRAAAGQVVADPVRHLAWLQQICAGVPDEPALSGALADIEGALGGAQVPWVSFQSGEVAATPTSAAGLGMLPQLAALQVGDWLSLDAPGHEPRLAKLAWCAADRSRFVFVNRLGQKSDEIDALALRARLAEGSARVVEQGDADLAERAWRRMLIGRHDDLAVQATRDPLTGLLDRREMERLLQAWLVAPERMPLLLLWFGVDHLRLVNQTHGMAAGDHLLCAVAATLQRYLDAGKPASGFAARAAGDEFVVIVAGLAANEAERRAIALFDQVNALEVAFEDAQMRVSLSMGMVSVDVASTSIGPILADAERACDAAKESGRGRWYRHQSDDVLLSHMRESANWVRRLDASLQSRGLVLFGQRAVWLGGDAGRQVDYIEVLLRMQSDDGFVAPGDFILAAERYGQIAAVDRYVIQELTRALQRVRPDCNARIAFNISARNIVDLAFVDEIIETLRQQPLPLTRLCVELTETAAIQHLDEAGAGMRRLTDAGLSMVLDDFGSGWSSYQYLRRLPFDVVKVDGAFIRDITRASEDRALASSINEIAHLLGKRTVAEHVEDQATLDEVRAIGFDYAQGYLLGKPMPLLEQIG
jgi:diguanylate cyclase (GGDEF)-like protein